MRAIKLLYLATCEQEWVWQMESGERARAHEQCVLLFDTCMLECSVKAAATAASEPREPHLARLAQLLSTSSTIITPLVQAHAQVHHTGTWWLLFVMQSIRSTSKFKLNFFVVHTRCAASLLPPLPLPPLVNQQQQQLQQKHLQLVSSSCSSSGQRRRA